MDAVTASLLTAAVGLLAAAIGAWLQSRREHAKWVREKRYEGYVRALAHLDEFSRTKREAYESRDKAEAVDRSNLAAVANLTATAERLHARLDRLEASVGSEFAGMHALGPDAVSDASQAVLDASGDYDRYQNAREAMIAEIRKVLDVTK